MTHAERLSWLANQEIECPGPNDASTNLDYYAYPVPGQMAHSPACICKGTGKVVRFPSLRQECIMRSDTQTCWQRDDSGEFKHPDGTRWTRKGCPTCQGRGWVPIDNLTVGASTNEAAIEALYFAVKKEGKQWTWI